MEITDIKIFKIDIQQSEVENIDKDKFPADLDIYLKGLIKLMISGESGRTFNFDRDTTEVRGQLGEIIKGKDFALISTVIAKRLLIVERRTQQKIAHLGKEIQKGIVVQALVTDNEINKFIICKAEHNDFLDEVKFTLSRGLPIKKKIFKGFACSMNSDQTLSNNLVYDKYLTNYWWNDFLELTKVHSDEDNTINAFDAIDKGVLVKLRTKYPQDYMHLSNSNIHYFRGNESFDMNDYVSNMFDNYLPFDDKLDIEKLKSDVRQLPKKSRKQFDEQFLIVKKQIKKRFIKNIALTPQIDLHFKEEIPDLENVVTAEIDDDGTKYVKVKSEQGYKYFNNLKERNTK